MIKDSDYSLEELIAVVAELAAEYTGWEHSSVTFERAQSLMDAVLYCINECEYANGTSLLTATVPARKRYLAGRSIVTEKAKNLQKLYNELIPDFEDYGSKCLKDTITKGIPMFLLRYDVKFAPQETLLTLDYPVLKDLGTLSGVDRILEYVTCISCEQRFLKKFDRTFVTAVLRAYHTEYELLIENICHIVFQNIICHIMMNKPLHSPFFDSTDFENTKKGLSGKSDKEIRAYMRYITEELVERYFNKDEELLHYLSGDIPDVVTSLQSSLRHHSLDTILF